MIKGGVVNFKYLSKIIEIIMKEYFSGLPVNFQKKVLEEAG